MPMDGLTLGFIVRELQKLVGARIDKIAQPERDELLLSIRTKGFTGTLLLSASAGHARVHLTENRKVSPMEPPQFLMILRKHLSGSRIRAVVQIAGDRIFEIHADSLNELGDMSTKRLVCEFMGKHSNIMLVAETGRIIDSMRHVTEEISRVRDVLPGLLYERPPMHDQLPFDALSESALHDRLLGEKGPLYKALATHISGLSGKTARELALRACGDADGVCEGMDAAGIITALHAVLATPAPSVITGPDGEPLDFCAFPYYTYREYATKPMDSLSAAMDFFYVKRDQQDRIKQKSAALNRILKNNIERCEKKLALQFDALEGSERMEEYRLKGDLLTASMHLIKKGAASAALPNYYDPDMGTLTVQLQPHLSPGQNAQRYFKLYQKARSAQKLAREQLDKTSGELAYLEGQLDNLLKCSEESEIVEIREELERMGYARANHNRRAKKALPPSEPLKFTSSKGEMIFVGKNNVQNDKLTASARAGDMWMHTKDIPGSHVIIASDKPDPQTLFEAAVLAAHFSKARASSNVPVDMTLKKYVKKPSGARPGFVIYTNQTTVFVTPDESVIAALKKNEEERL